MSDFLLLGGPYLGSGTGLQLGGPYVGNTINTATLPIAAIVVANVVDQPGGVQG
jgi:hypothetical protein